MSILTYLYFSSTQRGTTPSEAPDKTNNQPHSIKKTFLDSTL